MTVILNAAARIAQVKVQAAPPGSLYTKLVKVLGQPTRQMVNRKLQNREHVSWDLGHTRSRTINVSIDYEPKHDSTRLCYDGIADVVVTSGKDDKKVWADFKKEANKWLASGEATPEDRTYLEHILTAK